MKTIELARAKLRARLPEGESMPLFTAKEIVILEIMEEMKRAGRSHLAIGESPVKGECA